MPPNRLPLVDGDDGAWGDIINQFIEKEHYNTGTDDAANGSHKTITIRPGTTSAGTAPLKFSSGSLLSSAEAGAMEFLTDQLYFTVTTGAVRKTIAMYDDASGATGDMYYRNSSGNLVRIPIGSDGNILQVASGLPAWGAAGVTSVNGQTGVVTLTKSDVGLSDVDNTSDANKPLSSQAIQTFYASQWRKYYPQLRGWNAAVSGRATLPAKVAIIGDSITELFGSRIVDRFNAQYNNGPSAFHRPGSDYSAWTTWTGSKDTDHGMGYRGGTLSGSQEGTLAAFCDGFIVSYDVQSSGGADMEIYIDNILVDTVSTTDGAISGSIESGRLWTSGDIPLSNHTLKITRSGSGTVKIGGALYTNGNKAAKVQAWTAGFIGLETPDIIANEANYEAVKNLSPNLIIIHMGTNDYEEGIPSFQTSLTTVVQRFKSDNPLASILLVAPYESFDRPDWPDFVQVVKNVSASEVTAFVDMFESMGDIGGAGDIYDLGSGDNVHPTARGGQMMAATIVDAVMAPDNDQDVANLKADGSVPLTGALVLNAGANGSIGFGAIFNLPLFVAYRAVGDANAEFAMYGGAIGSFLTRPGFTMFFGTGGASAFDTALFRSNAAELTIGGAGATDLGNVKTELLRSNAGTPESVVTAPVGALSHDTSNGKLYVKGSGTGNTGWDIVASGSALNDKVTGPASATDNAVAQFDGTTGKLIKDSTKVLPSGVIVGTTDTQTLTNKTLTSPSISSPTGLVKADVGLSNVDNTADINKPLSNDAYTALTILSTPREILPTSAITQSIPRWIATGNLSLLTSGTLHLVAVSLRLGETITSITFCSRSTAMAGGNNQWFGLFNSSRQCLAVTNDAGAAAWGVNTFKTLNLTSPYAVPANGVYYIGVMVNATTVPTLAGIGNATALLSQGTPGLYGNSSTAQTTPFTVGNTAAALTNSGLGLAYAYVS